MALTIEELARQLDPSRTVLFFGAGAAVPSGAPSGDELRRSLCEALGKPDSSHSLAEVAWLFERRKSRRDLISHIETRFEGLKPARGLKVLPNYDWAGLYSTNYDTLLEQAFAATNKPLNAITCTSDWGESSHSDEKKFYKIHGTLGRDASSGDASRIIITKEDYKDHLDHKKPILTTLSSQLIENDLVVIGSSLGDSYLRQAIEELQELKRKAEVGTRAFVLLYNADEDDVDLLEADGFVAVPGSIDEFSNALIESHAPNVLETKGGEEGLPPALVSISKSVDEEMVNAKPDISRMYNGWPANLADIRAGYTFPRDVVDILRRRVLEIDPVPIQVLLGASGVGKSTVAWMLANSLATQDLRIWFHDGDYQLRAKDWREFAKVLEGSERRGLLVVDDAHDHLHELGLLIDGVVADGSSKFSVLAISSKGLWDHRVKSPNITRYSKPISMGRLSENEIDRLLELIERQGALEAVADATFSGFSRAQRKKRLKDRCESDMFVCLKNIFGTESFDDILLREYAEFPDDVQEIYRTVAAMESAGVRVHRQLIVRSCGISPTAIAGQLERLADVIQEYDINKREGIYGWRGRHIEVARLITKYKYNEESEFSALLDAIVENINPNYDIERRTIRQLASESGGIKKVRDPQKRNELLRKLISAAPLERVPRHRLIQNLIAMELYDQAEVEIRVFEKEFQSDASVARYRVKLALQRARHTPGLLAEDRLVIVKDAADQARKLAGRYKKNKHVLAVMCEVGTELYKRDKSTDCLDDGLALLRDLENETGDSDITRIIANIEHRFTIKGAPLETAS